MGIEKSYSTYELEVVSSEEVFRGKLVENERLNSVLCNLDADLSRPDNYKEFIRVFSGTVESAITNSTITISTNHPGRKVVEGYLAQLEAMSPGQDGFDLEDVLNSFASDLREVTVNDRVSRTSTTWNIIQRFSRQVASSICSGAIRVFEEVPKMDLDRNLVELATGFTDSNAIEGYRGVVLGENGLIYQALDRFVAMRLAKDFSLDGVGLSRSFIDSVYRFLSLANNLRLLLIDQNYSRSNAFVPKLTALRVFLVGEGFDQFLIDGYLEVLTNVLVGFDINEVSFDSEYSGFTLNNLLVDGERRSFRLPEILKALKVNSDLADVIVLAQEKVSPKELLEIYPISDEEMLLVARLSSSETSYTIEDIARELNNEFFVGVAVRDAQVIEMKLNGVVVEEDVVVEEEVLEEEVLEEEVLEEEVLEEEVLEEEVLEEEVVEEEEGLVEDVVVEEEGVEDYFSVDVDLMNGDLGVPESGFVDLAEVFGADVESLTGVDLPKELKLAADFYELMSAKIKAFTDLLDRTIYEGESHVTMELLLDEVSSEITRLEGIANSLELNLKELGFNADVVVQDSLCNEIQDIDFSIMALDTTIKSLELDIMANARKIVEAQSSGNWALIASLAESNSQLKVNEDTCRSEIKDLQNRRLQLNQKLAKIGKIMSGQEELLKVHAVIDKHIQLKVDLEEKIDKVKKLRMVLEELSKIRNHFLTEVRSLTTNTVDEVSKLLAKVQ